MLKVGGILKDPVVLIIISFLLLTAIAGIVTSIRCSRAREKRQGIVRACVEHKVYKEKWTVSESKKYCEIMNLKGDFQ